MDPMGLGWLKWLKEMGDAIGNGSATGTSETSARRARSKDLSGHGAPVGPDWSGGGLKF
jgi:hypothetical protein